MCGIAGIINLSGKLSRSELERYAKMMTDSISHRGPDDWGIWVEEDSRCVLAQRRLSIIDTSSAGHQPMFSRDGLAAITFNGEIYNYLELRNELEKQGSKFNTRTDTEVLIDAVRVFGEEAFKKMDAMYAFALWDKVSQITTLARDPFGEKPLYYTLQNGYFAFASELHALTLLPGFDATLDQDAIAQYLLVQYVPSPRTIYRSAQKLPPAHWMQVTKDGRLIIQRYFSFDPVAAPEDNRNIDDLADELEDILIRSTKRRLIADVPLGAFLSGGVDSSTVVALITKILGNKVKTFSIGFDESAESEHIAAREMARHLGSNHHEKILRPNAIALAKVIGKALDEPNSDSSCLPTYLLSQFAREQVTVALSGDGGDEMFGGYGRYFMTLAEAESPPAQWNVGDAYFSDRILIFAERHLTELLGGVPPETANWMQSLKAELNDQRLPLLSRLRRMDMNTYLHGAVLAKVDRMSMQHALEVRCPILSMDVARFAEKIAPSKCYRAGHGKLVLKRLAGRYIPTPWLERSKKGFGLPIDMWGQELFVKQLRELCLSSGAMAQHWLGRENIENFVLKQQRRETFSAYQAWAILILEIWLREHLTKQTSSDSLPDLILSGHQSQRATLNPAEMVAHG